MKPIKTPALDARRERERQRRQTEAFIRESRKRSASPEAKAHAAAIRATEAALLAIALLRSSGHNCGPMLDRIREACDA